MEKKLGWKMEKYMKLMIFSLKLFNSLLYMSCSLSGNTLSSSNSSSLVIQPSGSNGITFKSTTPPVDYISNKNNLIIESGGTISLNFLSNNYTTTTTYGSFTGDTNGNLIISSGSSGSLNLNSNYGNGQINLQNGLNTYGTFKNDTNDSDISGITSGGNNLTIGSGYVGSNPGSIKFEGAGQLSGDTIAVAVGQGYFNSANLSMYYNSNVNNGSAIINTPNWLTLQSNNSIYLNTISANNSINLQSGNTTYGTFTGNSSSMKLDASGSITFTATASQSSITLTATNGNVNINANGGNSINLSAASSIFLNMTGGGSVTTNYNANWNTSGNGIVNQKALAQMFQSGTFSFQIAGTITQSGTTNTNFTPSMVFLSLDQGSTPVYFIYSLNYYINSTGFTWFLSSSNSGFFNLTLCWLAISF